MRKNILKATFVAALAVFAGYNVYQKQDSNILSDLTLANVEAIASNESSGTNYNLCYSQSKVVKGRTYYDCGNCTKKIYDERGKGTYTKCFY